MFQTPSETSPPPPPTHLSTSFELMYGIKKKNIFLFYLDEKVLNKKRVIRCAHNHTYNTHIHIQGTHKLTNTQLQNILT